MKLNYNLEENDYLNFQLYYVSQNEKAKKQQRSSRYSVTAICAVFSIVSFVSDRQIMGFYFLISTVVCFFFFPKYAAWLYKRSLKKHVAQIYKENAAVFTTLVIDNKEIIYTRQEKTSTFPCSRIEKIIELQDLFLIKIGIVEYIIIPKDKLLEVGEVKSFFENLCRDEDIMYCDELEWAWGKN